MSIEANWIEIIAQGREEGTRDQGRNHRNGGGPGRMLMEAKFVAFGGLGSPHGRRQTAIGNVSEAELPRT